MGGIRKKNSELKNKIVEYVNSFFFENIRSPYMSELAEEFGISKSTAFRYIQELSFEGKLKYDGKNIVTDTIEKTDTSVQYAPVVGKIACGTPNIAEENFEEFVSLPQSLFGKGDFFVLRAFGNSMIDAGINEGDMVVIRKQNTADDGDIVVFMNSDHDATLKRIHYNDQKHHVILHPENKDLSDIVITDPEECTILGVACYIIKKI